MDIFSRSTINFIVLFVIFFDFTDATPYQNYSDLHAALFKDYNINLRPVKDDSTTVEVSVDFVLLSIDGISEKEQSLTTNGWLILEWFDEILTWDEATSGVPSFTLQQKTIWRPDVTIKNTVKQRSKIGFDEQPVTLSSNGRVLWAPGDIFSTSCDLRVTYYPFDVQNCNIVIYLWTSPDKEIKLSAAEKNVSLKFYSENGLWEIVSTSTSTETVNDFTEIIFTLKLKRRRLFYVVNIIIPIVFLSCLAPMVFALPAESGEKMGFCVTVLLAYTVFLTILGDSIPKTSIQTATLSVYLTTMVIISATSVLLSTLVLRIHNKPEDTSPPPKLQKVTSVLRRFLCLDSARRANTITPAVHTATEKSDKGYKESKNRLKTIQSVSDVEEDVTWKMVSETLDTVFLVVFVVLTFVITVPSLAVMAAQS